MASETETQATRQTLSYLQQMFSQRGLRPKNKLGQNFLIDLNLLDVVMKNAELSKDDLALEIGTGTGNLTGMLSRVAGTVLSVEIDRDFHVMAQEHLVGRSNVVLMQTDVLKNKNQLNPAVMERIAGLREQHGFRHIKLIANLPYAVAVPVMSNLLLTDLPIERMIVMIQFELAERLVATPSTKPFGALAVMMQSLADVVPIKSRVPPTVFWPRPKVASAIVGIFPNAAKRALVGDVIAFRVFLRDLYAHRRKNLRGALAALPGKPWDKPTIDARLTELGIPTTARAESLDVAQHLALSKAFATGTDHAAGHSHAELAEL